MSSELLVFLFNPIELQLHAFIIIPSRIPVVHLSDSYAIFRSNNLSFLIVAKFTLENMRGSLSFNKIGTSLGTLPVTMQRNVNQQMFEG